MTRTQAMKLLLGGALFALGTGCGPDPYLVAAEDTLMTTMAAVDEAEQVVTAAEDGSGEGAVDARQAYDRARVRLDEAEGIVQTWRDTGHGKLAWVTLSPCLAASLVGLRMTLSAVGLTVPDDLHQAEVMAAEPAGDECASEPRPTTSGGETPASDAGAQGEGDQPPEPAAPPDPDEADGESATELTAPDAS